MRGVVVFLYLYSENGRESERETECLFVCFEIQVCIMIYPPIIIHIHNQPKRVTIISHRLQLDIQLDIQRDIQLVHRPHIQRDIQLVHRPHIQQHWILPFHQA